MEGQDCSTMQSLSSSSSSSDSFSGKSISFVGQVTTATVVIFRVSVLPALFEEGNASNGSNAGTAGTDSETAGSAVGAGVGVDGTWSSVGGGRKENDGEVGFASAVGTLTGVDGEWNGDGGNCRKNDGEVGFASSEDSQTLISGSGSGGLVSSGDSKQIKGAASVTVCIFLAHSTPFLCWSEVGDNENGTVVEVITARDEGLLLAATGVFAHGGTDCLLV